MKKAIRYFGIFLLLCAPVAATAQTRTTNSANRERAMKIGASVERTIRTKESGWRKKVSLESEFGLQTYFNSGDQKADVSIFVYDSPEEASKQLGILARSSSIAAEKELKGMGDEAFYMSHRYFSWIGVRQGTTVVAVYGPPELSVTRRFARYGLDQIAK